MLTAYRLFHNINMEMQIRILSYLYEKSAKVTIHAFVTSALVLYGNSLLCGLPKSKVSS